MAHCNRDMSSGGNSVRFFFIMPHLSARVTSRLGSIEIHSFQIHVQFFYGRESQSKRLKK